MVTVIESMWYLYNIMRIMLYFLCTGTHGTSHFCRMMCFCREIPYALSDFSRFIRAGKPSETPPPLSEHQPQFFNLPPALLPR